MLRSRRALLLVPVVALTAVLVAWLWARQPDGAAGPVVTLPDLSGIGAHLRGLLAEVETRAREHMDDPEAQGQFGRALHAERVDALARHCYENALRLDPENHVWWYYLARLDDRDARRADAIAKYRRVVGLAPDYPFAHLYLGNALLEAGEPDAAEESYRRFVELAPREPGGWIGLGRVARARRHFGRARSHLERGLKLAPDDGQVHYHLGVVLRDLGEADAAKRHLGRSQRLGKPLPPYDPLMVQVTDAGVSYRILVNRAKQADRTGNRQKALDIAKRLLAQYPEDSFVYYFYGSLCLKIDDLAAADKHLRRAIDLQADYADAMVLLAGMFRQMGRMEEGRQWHERAVAIHPNEPSVHYNLAIGFARIERYADAVEGFRRAAELDPDNPSRHKMLGDALTRIDRQDEAAKAYRAAERAAGLVP